VTVRVLETSEWKLQIHNPCCWKLVTGMVHAAQLKDVSAQIYILHEIAQMAIHIVGIYSNLSTAFV